ncbi:hypothetical protein CROQUDRAFT_36322, partial [Cronartium quercuum f. sp. fusiforme G11]
EEEHLAVSYITVSKEPKWANNQSGLAFCKKVTGDFNARSNIVQCDYNLNKFGDLIDLGVVLYAFVCICEVFLPGSQASHSTDGPTHHHHPQKDTTSIEGVVRSVLKGIWYRCPNLVWWD